MNSGWTTSKPEAFLRLNRQQSRVVYGSCLYLWFLKKCWKNSCLFSHSITYFCVKNSLSRNIILPALLKNKKVGNPVTFLCITWRLKKTIGYFLIKNYHYANFHQDQRRSGWKIVKKPLTLRIFFRIINDFVHRFILDRTFVDFTVSLLILPFY
jgi:hypothetical protein